MSGKTGTFRILLVRKAYTHYNSNMLVVVDPETRTGLFVLPRHLTEERCISSTIGMIRRGVGWDVSTVLGHLAVPHPEWLYE